MSVPPFSLPPSYSFRLVHTLYQIKKRRQFQMNTAKNGKTHRRAARAATPTEQHPLLLLARAVLRGVLIALICALVISPIAAIIAYMSADPDSLLLPLGLGTLAVVALVCGLITRRYARLSPLLCGTLGGLALLALWFVLSCLLPDDLRGSFSPAVGWGLRGGVIIFSLLGAAMGANMPKKNRRPKRRA